MSSELEKKLETKKDELIALLDKATEPETAAKINEVFEKIKKVKLRISGTIRRLEQVYKYVKTGNRNKARKIYETYFFNMSQPYAVESRKIRAKRLLSVDEIQKFLDKKDVVKNIINKLKRVDRFFSEAMKYADKIIKVYTLICNVKKNLTDIAGLYEAQKKLKTAEDYRQYYKRAGKIFSDASSAMKVVTSILLRGARDYCDFIFTVAQDCYVAVEIVSKHTEKILKICKEIDVLIEGLGEKNSKSNISTQIGNKTIPGSPEDGYIGYKSY